MRRVQMLEACLEGSEDPAKFTEHRVEKKSAMLVSA